MNQGPQGGLAPAPPIYDNILVLGGGRGDEPLTARIGGIFGQPNLGLSYLLAARHVIEAGHRDGRFNEVALPASYLQRHSLELALKDVIGIADHLRSYNDWQATLEADPNITAPPQTTPATGHDFNALRTRAERALQAVGFQLPASIAAMSQELRDVEGPDPSRFRYLTARDEAEFFPAPETLRVGDVQTRLEAMFYDHLSPRDYSLPQAEWNLATALSAEGEGAMQQLLRYKAARVYFGVEDG